ncbi:hypothetical protein BC629DRAFT_1592046 [Irpex lacteus]|nr:hypothetical protein BC629DRAFT_1592046 [Irpex lacteus]
MPANPQKFASSFDDEDADIVVLSSDKIEFRVFKFLLRKASPVWASMLTLPQPPRDEDTIPIMKLSEDSRTIAQLLRLCYPVPDPAIPSFDEARTLFVTCQKYDMQVPSERLLQIVTRTFQDTDPFRFYILACRARSIKAARIAALSCLSMPLEDILNMDIPDVRDLSMLAYRNLLQYYDACRKAAAQALSLWKFPWLTVDDFYQYCWAFRCVLKRGLSRGRTVYIDFQTDYGGKRVEVEGWWVELMDSIIAQLQHKAAPMSPQLFDFIDPPKDKMCKKCKINHASSLHRFFNLLDEELKRRVKAVEFNVIF